MSRRFIWRDVGEEVMISKTFIDEWKAPTVYPGGNKYRSGAEGKRSEGWAERRVS